jgi:outer membrane protein assembly factor BamB
MGADWRQFRGNNTDSVAVSDTLPTTWSEKENIAWKVPLKGRGLSGPVIVGDRVYITSSSGVGQTRLHVQCFSVKTGELAWERQFWATGRTQTHKKMCVATPTPASDGKRLFAFYSSNDLACLDLDGNLLWFRGLTHDFPNASNSLGMASSPVVVGDTVIVQVESDADSFSTGIDVATGVARWRKDRPRKVNWTSPAVLKTKSGETLALLQSSVGLSAVKPKTGEVVWSFDGGASTTPSCTVADGTVYVPSSGVTALLPQGKEKPKVVWKSGRLSPSTPSPLVYGGRVFAVNRAGALTAADAKTGDVVWQMRMQGPFTSTPVAAGGLLYFFNEKGLGQVVKPSEKAGEIVGTSPLEATILCSPAVAGNALYVRSDGHLWKISK